MRDLSKEHQELIEENALLKQRIQELEKSEAEFKKVEETLKETETRYRLLFEHSPDGILIIDTATARFLKFNEAAHRQLGYSREEFSKLSILDLEVAETAQETRSRMTHVVQKGRADFDTLQRNREGEIRNVHVTAQHTEVFGKAVYHCVWRDITERKRTEEALRASELTYQTIFETTGTGMVILDEDMTISLVNDRFESLSGYSREEVEGKKKWTEFVEKDDLEKMTIQHRLRRVDSGLAAKSYEFRLVHRDGCLKNILLTIDIIQGTKKSIASLMDITYRKQAEEALLESEIKFKSITEQALVGTYILQDGIFKYVNPKFAQMFGYTVEECLNKIPFEKLVHPEDLVNVKEQVRRRTAGEIEFIHYNFRGMKKDGQLFHVEIYGSLSVHKGRSAAAGTLLDVTDRRQAEEALLESEIKFKSFAEQSIVGTYILQDGTIKYVNPKFAQMFGYTVEECLNKMPFEKLVHPEDLVNVKEQIRRRTAGEIELIHYSFRGMKKNGQTFPVEIYGSSSVHEGRSAAAGTLLDITERKQAEEERRRYEKLQGVLEMAGAICHEMNQPMQIISGHSEMLLMNTSENHPLHAKLNAINSQIQRMGNITKKLMKIKDFDTQDYAGFSRIININKSAGNENE